MSRFRDILAQPKRFDRCDDTYGLISDFTENKLNAEREPEPLRTITLVWFSNGIIGNGGFAYLFMADLPGDPGYVYTAASYTHIGAQKAYSAFKRALALFPNNSPPLDVNERRKMFSSFDEAKIDAIERDFYDADTEIEECLDGFILRNADEIEKIIGAEPSSAGDSSTRADAGFEPPEK